MTAQKTRDDGLDQGGLHTIRPSDCCNFTSQVVDKGCPRFIKFQWTASAGLGDRFFQYIMMLKMGMDMHAVPVFDPKLFTADNGHGAYPWALDLLQPGLGEMTESEMNAAFPSIEEVELTVRRRCA
jgi:hypothetical protein